MSEPAFYDDLAATLDEAWRRLDEGVRDRRSGFHSPTLATLGLDGRPRARVVVLRAAEPGPRRIAFHCDARSEKVAEIGRDPRAALTAYDAPAKIQVRVEGPVALHRDDAQADAAWAASRPASRATYGVRPASGAPIPAGGGYDPPAGEAAGEGAFTRSNFLFGVMAVERLEFLYLARAGHRRARFAWDAAGGLAATWLVP